MEIIETKCVCLDFRKCEKKYIKVKNFEAENYTFSICRELLSSRIQKFELGSYNKRIICGNSIDNAYCELIKEYIPKMNEISLNPIHNNWRDNTNNILNRGIHFTYCHRPYLMLSISVKDFLELCYDKPILFYFHFSSFSELWFNYCENKDTYKKYKNKFQNAYKIIKRMEKNFYNEGIFQTLVNELLIEVLSINGKIKQSMINI